MASEQDISAENGQPLPSPAPSPPRPIKKEDPELPETRAQWLFVERTILQQDTRTCCAEDCGRELDQGRYQVAACPSSDNRLAGTTPYAVFHTLTEQTLETRTLTDHGFVLQTFTMSSVSSIRTICMIPLLSVAFGL
ncbi:hypothetical protein A1O3_04209 [Capronia epimyces CBS 606.96]|uniref:Uncharacterized protein n=1 Tax=Capronia epimyces CBS 606.96 TaxID=1182542 RepID=W9YC47_9EURO|nr:uncharacterized protein A1O3_04209 [Capronia epimyces CBS 606.96]EXJ87250.1 hypothetical protein A1O3_04209 [Capronia epimyces CBS 606.96]